MGKFAVVKDCKADLGGIVDPIALECHFKCVPAFSNLNR